MANKKNGEWREAGGMHRTARRDGGNKRWSKPVSRKARSTAGVKSAARRSIVFCRAKNNTNNERQSTKSFGSFVALFLFLFSLHHNNRGVQPVLVLVLVLVFLSCTLFVEWRLSITIAVSVDAFSCEGGCEGLCEGVSPCSCCDCEPISVTPCSVSH